MDYQQFVDCVGMPCCVMAVEKKSDHGYGDIRIVYANQAYRDTMGPSYYDGMLYHELVPKDNKFEDYCYRAAILGQRMHAYVETVALKCWTDQTLIPLKSEDENVGYLQFIFEFTPMGEADRMASVSMNVAEQVITSCIRLMGSENFLESIHIVLDDILRVTEGSAARIMLMDRDNHEATILGEVLDEAAWPDRKDGEEDVITYDMLLSWEKLIGVSNNLLVRGQEEIEGIAKKDPLWAAGLKKYGVNTLVLLPLRREKVIFGYLYVVNLNAVNISECKEFLELMSFFLSSEIHSHLLMKKLEEISNIDALTGLQNRRAMISCLERFKDLSKNEKYAFGILNIDLNGLKIVNDRDGHEAGDLMLRHAAEVLQDHFGHKDLYRIGGDEFIVITREGSQEEFEEKIRTVRKEAADRYGLSFAMGGFWCDGNHDITTAIHIADERMYEDKKAFYEKNPSMSRRR